MEQHTLQELVDKNMSTRTISKTLNVSQTTVRYWLMKYSIKTNYISKFNDESKSCRKCNVIKHKSEYYFKDKHKNTYQSECKTCFNSRITAQYQQLKSLCVAYMGGKCKLCGYDKYQGALEFHHIDPCKKDFSISMANSRVFNDKIKQELEKCILVCSNCHREIHAGITSCSSN